MPTTAIPSTCPPAGFGDPLRKVPVNPAVVETMLANLPLRLDQEDAVRAFFTGLADRSRVGTIEMPTGTGKTWVGVAAAL